MDTTPSEPSKTFTNVDCLDAIARALWGEKYDAQTFKADTEGSVAASKSQAAAYLVEKVISPFMQDYMGFDTPPPVFTAVSSINALQTTLQAQDLDSFNKEWITPERVTRDPNEAITKVSQWLTDNPTASDVLLQSVPKDTLPGGGWKPKAPDVLSDFVAPPQMRKQSDLSAFSQVVNSPQAQPIRRQNTDPYLGQLFPTDETEEHV